MKRLTAALLMAGMVAACAQAPATPGRIDTDRETAIVSLVAAARQDRLYKTELAKVLMSGPVFVIPDPKANPLTLLFFDQPERSFIPVFSSRRLFDEEAYGTGFEGKAVPIDATRFASLLKGDEVVILNPGHRPAIDFSATELKDALAK
jgi:SseB protein N-terminal domain